MRAVAHHAEPAPLAEQQAEHQSGDARADVHHVAACEVERADDIADEAAIAAPDHVRERRIDDRNPQCDKRDDGSELHAAGYGAGDDGTRDHGEGHLETDVDDGGVGGIFWNVGCLCQHVAGCREASHLVESAEEWQRPVAAVRERPSACHPHHSDDADDREYHHHGVHDVLAPRKAAVEEREARCHECDQHRAHNHECGGACVVHTNHFLSGNGFADSPILERKDCGFVSGTGREIQG